MSLTDFNTLNRNQINMAIMGAVSAGKSTLLNAMFVARYSDMKIKRTTMNPQVYFETNKLDKTNADTIKENNARINKILDQKEQGEITLEDITESHYIVPRVKNLVELNQNIFLTVYDVPGLNDSQTKNVYFQYIDNNFYKFDIIILVVDIHSALNTSDESDILENILKNSRINYEKYGIHNKLVVVANKLDEMQWFKGTYKFLDAELAVMYSQIEKIVKERVLNIFPTMEYNIVPLGSEDSYIYRMYNQAPNYDLDIKHINKFGYNEYGRSRWNRLTDNQKKSKISKLMQTMKIEETLKHTGFYGFSKSLGNFLDSKNQYTFLTNHLKYGLQKITNYTQLDIHVPMTEFYSYYLRFKEINVSFHRKTLGKKIYNRELLYQYLNEFINNYKNNVVAQYIDLEQEKLKSETHISQLEEIKHQFEEYSSKFNQESENIENIKNLVIESLNNYYVTNIKNKEKGITTLINYLYQLFKDNFIITYDLVEDIFDNNDMKNKTIEEVLKHLDNLEEKKLINKNNKKDIILKFLKTLYIATLQGEPLLSIPLESRSEYYYQCDLLWTKIMINNKIGNHTINLSEDGLLYELSYLVKKNMAMYINQTPYLEVGYSGNKLKLEKNLLELYYKPIIKPRQKRIEKTLVNEKKIYSSSDTDDEYCLSEELDCILECSSDNSE